MSLMVSAFLGVISQVIMLALEFLPMIYGALVAVLGAVQWATSAVASKATSAS
jgi:hypothetical protein